ncbi:MAG: DUF3996 domain-containing protein [Spirochaetes bacterium]|nr:DUF3996 domain-containing protein [Spirochaetota bacterium]
MKKYIFVIILLVMMISEYQLGAEPKFGGGFILGDPSGLTAKLFLDEIYAVDCGIGPSAYDGFYLYGDFMRHFPGLFPVKELSLYIGIGAGFHNHDKQYNNRRHDDDEGNSLEVRMPFGVEYTFKDVPVGIFLEIAPSTEIIPDFDFHLRGGTGARYYF